MRKEKSKSKEVRNRKPLTDAICTVMHDRFRDDSIDSLLTRPVDAIEMSLDVAVRMGQISQAAGNRIRASLRKSFNDEPGAENALAAICRAALTSRKRGELKKDRY